MLRFLTSSPVECKLNEHLDGLIRLPVIMLVADRAITPGGSDGIAEMVPLKVLQDSVSKWSGKPVTLGHPASGLVTDANNLDMDGTVEDNSSVDAPVVGHLESPMVRDDRLHAIAVLDSKLIRLAGREDLLQDLTMRMLEVSIGGTVRLDWGSGHDSQGTEYGLVWLEIVEPDHLAILTGVEGACDNSMGCGLPRVAQRNGDEMNENIVSRFLGVLERLMYGSTDTLEDGVSKLEGENKIDAKVATAGCGCGSSENGVCACDNGVASADDTNDNQPQGGDSVNVDDLIALESSPYTEADKEVLSGFSVNRISELTEHYSSAGEPETVVASAEDTTNAEPTSAEPAPSPVIAQAAERPTPDNGVVITAEQAIYFNKLVEREQRRQAQEKQELIDRLVSANAYTQESVVTLRDRSIDDLKEYVRLAELNTVTNDGSATDFGVINRGVVAANSEVNSVPPPVPTDLRSLFASKLAEKKGA